MKATCPNGCATRRFLTTAHVCEDWVVDEAGNFLGFVGGPGNGCVVSDPDPANVWTCETCGAAATFQEGGAA